MKKKVIKLSKMPTYLLPSVVDMSGAGIKRTVVMNQEILQHKNKRKL